MVEHIKARIAFHSFHDIMERRTSSSYNAGLIELFKNIYSMRIHLHGFLIRKNKQNLKC